MTTVLALFAAAAPAQAKIPTLAGTTTVNATSSTWTFVRIPKRLNFPTVGGPTSKNFAVESTAPLAGIVLAGDPSTFATNFADGGLLPSLTVLRAKNSAVLCGRACAPNEELLIGRGGALASGSDDPFDGALDAGLYRLIAITPPGVPLRATITTKELSGAVAVTPERPSPSTASELPRVDDGTADQFRAWGANHEIAGPGVAVVETAGHSGTTVIDQDQHCMFSHAATPQEFSDIQCSGEEAGGNSTGVLDVGPGAQRGTAMYFGVHRAVWGLGGNLTEVGVPSPDPSATAAWVDFDLAGTPVPPPDLGLKTNARAGRIQLATRRLTLQRGTAFVALRCSNARACTASVWLTGGRRLGIRCAGGTLVRARVPVPASLRFRLRHRRSVSARLLVRERGRTRAIRVTLAR